MDRINKQEKSILIPCCKNSWFHQNCLQKFAYTSGVCFKCPMCNNKDKCYEILPKLGIYLPLKDADWEYDIETYEIEEDVPVVECDAENCLKNQFDYDNLLPLLWRNC